jgi:hypothetical protein
MHYFFTLLHYHASTCFRPICSPSSVGQVYNVVNGTCFTFKATVAGPHLGPPTVALKVKQVPSLGVSMLASDTQVRGFEPGRSCRIFQGGKILSMPSFVGEVKPSVQCHSFAACKKSLQ